MGEQFGPGGAGLYESLAEPGDPPEMAALCVEAARIKDRLDRLAGILGGDVDTWACLAPSRGDGEVLEVKIDGAAAEARQLATVFRQMLAEIRRRRDAAGERDDDDPLADL